MLCCNSSPEATVLSRMERCLRKKANIKKTCQCHVPRAQLVKGKTRQKVERIFLTQLHFSRRHCSVKSFFQEHFFCKIRHRSKPYKNMSFARDGIVCRRPGKGESMVAKQPQTFSAFAHSQSQFSSG